MQSIQSKYHWLKPILPEGIPIPSGTIITGPGVSGMPIIGYALVAAWLRQGGSVVFLLTNIKKADAEKSLSHYNVEINQYQHRIFFAELNPAIVSEEVYTDNLLGINLIIPENWDLLSEEACQHLTGTSLQTLYFGAGVNLLLFSVKYQRGIVNKITSLMRSPNSSIFTVSNEVLRNEIRQLESSADNVMVIRTDRALRLYLRILRMKGVRFQSDEVEVPIDKKDLRHMRKDTHKNRKNLITVIKTIG